VNEELPAVAEARMAEIRRSGTWGSALTSDEFAVIRSVGFEPVGQVLGAAVYNVGYTGGYNCPGAWGYGYGYGGVIPARTTTQVSSRGGFGSFAPLVQTMYDARHKALDRMTTECAELGGHGVVGVRLTIGSFPAGGLEFKAIGTAIRAPGVPPVSAWSKGRGHKQPFTSDLSGQDFGKLIMKGWAPAGLVLGISIGSRHDDWLTVGQTRWGSGNAEVVGYTELVNDARHDARRQLERDVTRLGAEGVVIATMEMNVRERECPVQEGRRDHIVEATIIGTAITRFTDEQRHSRPTLAVMSLDPQRRQAARIRI
jgi:uncharacterized protein YbjQ (UPF0145 family)